MFHLVVKTTEITLADVSRSGETKKAGKTSSSPREMAIFGSTDPSERPWSHPLEGQILGSRHGFVSVVQISV